MRKNGLVFLLAILLIIVTPISFIVGRFYGYEKAMLFRYNNELRFIESLDVYQDIIAKKLDVNRRSYDGGLYFAVREDQELTADEYARLKTSLSNAIEKRTADEMLLLLDDKPRSG